MPGKTTLRLTTLNEDIVRAAELLRRGGLVAMPTETVYGLAANALDPSAVASIFLAKERPGWDPLIVHISSRAMLGQVAAEMSATAEALAAAFWPGPLTLLLPRAPGIGDGVTAGRPLVGVRWPSHPAAQALIGAAGLPLAAPSANRFGRTSPSTADHVLAHLDGRIDAVLDDGPASIGLESTVLDPNTDPVVIYRQGAVRRAEIELATGRATHLFQPGPSSAPQSLPSPGVGIRHYAPRTPLRLAESQRGWQQMLAAERGKAAFLCPNGWPLPAAGTSVLWGDWDNSAQLAQRLYAALHELDAVGADEIIAPLPESREGDDLRAAIRDRLLKAAMKPMDSA